MENEHMVTLKETLDRLPPEIRQSLGRGALHRMSALKRVRKGMVGEALDVTEVDAEIDLLKGSKTVLGLFQVLDVEDDGKKKPEPEKAEVPGEQRDLEDDRDYRTHDLTKTGVAELVSKIVANHPPAGAISQLNALEDGERDREPKPRNNVLQVIRDARAPLVAKVRGLRTDGNGSGPALVN